MKKIFTLLVAILFTIAMKATEYTDKLWVSVNGIGMSQMSTINVDQNNDGTYKLSINNFMFGDLGVGNIVLDNVSGITEGNLTTIQTKQIIGITEGNAEGVDMWLGPALGEVPVDMIAEIRDDKLYTVINIDMSESLGQIINVVFGTGGYQIPNSDFEEFHIASYGNSTSDEPNNWHSFMSCDGSLANMVSGTPHTFISDDVREGSNGTKCVKLSSGVVKVIFFSVPANGTLTTGRLTAGSTTATNTDNHSYLDLSKTDKDANGDPFYAILNGKPDSISFWAKFIQAENLSSPYATVSAVITDGTYYQDPEDKSYTNVVAKASNSEIASNGGVWQQITVPFDYDTYAENNADVKAILVTLSTNAKPGVGSKNGTDDLYIDDFQLVYNSKLASLKFKGQDVEGFDKETYAYNITSDGVIALSDIEAISDGKGAYVTKDVEDTADGVKVTVTVTSNDLKEQNVYVLDIADVTTVIDNVETEVDNSTIAIYNINGQKVDNMFTSGVYILRKADGTSVKVTKK